MAHGLREAMLLAGGGVVGLVGAGGKTSLMYRLARELSDQGEKVLTTTTTRILTPTPEQSPACILGAAADDILDQAGGMLKRHRHITAAAGVSTEAGKLTGLKPETIDRLQASRVFNWIIVEADGAAGRPLKAPAGHEPVIPATAGWMVAMVGLSAVGKPLSEEWVFRSQVFARLTGMTSGAAVTEESVALALCHEAGILKGGHGQCRRMVFLNQGDISGGIESGTRIVGHLRRLGGCGVERVVIGQVQCESPVCGVYDLKV